MQSEFITEKENRKRLSNQLSELIEERQNISILLAMDFDECVLENHISREVTTKFTQGKVVSEYALSHNDIPALWELTSAYIGLSSEVFQNALKEIADKVTWKPTFLETMPKIMARQDIFPIFISSGIRPAITTALTQQGLNVPVIAGEVRHHNGEIIDVHNVLTSTDKQFILEEAATRLNVQRLVTLGHSRGDLDLVAAGTPGYRLAYPDCPEIIAVSDHQIQNFDDILSFLHE